MSWLAGAPSQTRSPIRVLLGVPETGLRTLPLSPARTESLRRRVGGFGHPSDETLDRVARSASDDSSSGRHHRRCRGFRRCGCRGTEIDQATT